MVSTRGSVFNHQTTKSIQYERGQQKVVTSIVKYTSAKRFLVKSVDNLLNQLTTFQYLTKSFRTIGVVSMMTHSRFVKTRVHR